MYQSTLSSDTTVVIVSLFSPYNDTYIKREEENAAWFLPRLLMVFAGVVDMGCCMNRYGSLHCWAECLIGVLLYSLDFEAVWDGVA